MRRFKFDVTSNSRAPVDCSVASFNTRVAGGRETLGLVRRVYAGSDGKSRLALVLGIRVGRCLFCVRIRNIADGRKVRGRGTLGSVRRGDAGDNEKPRLTNASTIRADLANRRPKEKLVGVNQFCEPVVVSTEVVATCYCY